MHKSHMQNDDFLTELRKSLKEQGKSQGDLARYMGVDTSIVNKILRGKRNIKADELLQISAFLSGTPKFFFQNFEKTVPSEEGAYHAGVVEAGAFRETPAFTSVEALMDTERERYISVPSDDRFPAARLYVFDALGDSVNDLKPCPILHGAMLVAVDYEDVSDHLPLREAMVVVVERSRDGGLTHERSVKQIVIHDDHIEFSPRSTSIHFKAFSTGPQLETESNVTVRVIAVVRRIMHEVPLW